MRTKKRWQSSVKSREGSAVPHLHQKSNGARIAIFFPIYFFSVPELTAESKKLSRNHLEICSVLENWEYPVGGSCAAEYL